MKKTMFFVVAALLTIFSISSCSKEVRNKNIKVEITTSALSDGDNFLCTIAAAAATGPKDLKVNGVTRSNEGAISLNKTDIVNNTVTIETAENAMMLVLTVGGTSDATPYTITVKPTVKGSAKETTSFTVDSEGDSRNLTYQ